MWAATIRINPVLLVIPPNTSWCRRFCVAPREHFFRGPWIWEENIRASLMLLSSLHFLIVMMVCHLSNIQSVWWLIAVNSMARISSTLLCIEFSISYKIIHMDGSLSVCIGSAALLFDLASLKSDVNSPDIFPSHTHSFSLTCNIHRRWMENEDIACAKLTTITDKY